MGLISFLTSRDRNEEETEGQAESSTYGTDLTLGPIQEKGMGGEMMPTGGIFSTGQKLQAMKKAAMMGGRGNQGGLMSRMANRNRMNRGMQSGGGQPMQGGSSPDLTNQLMSIMLKPEYDNELDVLRQRSMGGTGVSAPRLNGIFSDLLSGTGR